MAFQKKREKTVLANMFTENTDISLDSNRHMMLHELQKLTQEIRNVKSELYIKVEKCKRLESENDTQRMQELLVEMNEMKLCINELKTERQRTNTENNELRTQVTDLREKQEKEINELRLITTGQETKTNELETKSREKYVELQTRCCYLEAKNMILKELILLLNAVVLPGLKEQILAGCRQAKNWLNCIAFLKEHLTKDSKEYKQLEGIGNVMYLPINVVVSNSIELLRVLLRNGLPANEENMLFDAIMFERYDILKLLIAAGADVNMRNKNSETALWNAVARDQVNIVTLLINNGADINAINGSSRWTPLHYAAAGNQESIIKVLVDSGARINVTDIYGRTPLHLAAENGRLSVVKLLVTNGCDKSILNKDGVTALDRAIEENHIEVVNYLDNM